MKRTVLFVLFLLLGLFVVESSAIEVAVFAPHSYLRTEGAKNIYTDEFSAIPGDGKLIVTNGNYCGDRRIEDSISSASIIVNGEQIFGPNDFNKHSYCLEACISLNEANTIVIELASKPDSYITVEVTEEVAPPSVVISAEPNSISEGDSATLSWSSTNCQCITIDKGIGDVDLCGSITVSPMVTTTYTITAVGLIGTATADVTVRVISPITLEITSPSEGATVSGPDSKVQGTITSTSNTETGVVVNGVIAIVYDGQFVANHVSVEKGGNTITATAKDINGNTTNASITINAETTGDYIRLTTDTESGTAPLETTLKVVGSFSFTESSITCIGPGQVEFPENPIENEHTVKMTTPGVYYFTAEVTDTENNTYTDTIAIQALDKAELDAFLRAKWEGMRQALAQNDIDTATGFFADSKKDAYQRIFTALSSKLPQISQELGDIQFIRMMYNSAEYDIRTTRDGNEYSYYLLFVKDENGLWKIMSF
jgi:hypothetical protein